MKHTPKESAVSPVIGIILMVVITVILAAVIAAFVFGAAGSVQKSKLVAATVQQSAQDIRITYQGGVDNLALDYLTVQIPGSEITSPNDCTAYYYTATTNGGELSDGALATTVPAMDGAGKPIVGASYTLDDCGTTDYDRVIITGHFTDGSDQVILETSV